MRRLFRKPTTILASVAMIATLIAAFPLLSTTAATACTTAAAAGPVQRDISVNQGLDSYSTLTRRKRTVVRVYLSEPTGVPAGCIRLTGASLSVAVSGATTQSVPQPTPAIGSTYPIVDAYTVSPQNDSPGNPTFVVDGSLLDSPTTGPVTASFTAKVFYQYQDATTGAWVSGPPTGAALTGTTRTVSQKTNALRILVVPVGDASKAATYFPAAAQQAVQNGMQTLSRVLPVADGVNDLSINQGGIRYSINPSMLDLSASGLNVLDTKGKYCADGRFGIPDAYGKSVSSQLIAMLNDWNSANNTSDKLYRQADRVLGVGWQDYTNGSTNGCDAGIALINSRVAFVRAFSDTSGSPSMTGALTVMEMAHTWGSVVQPTTLNPSPDWDPNSSYHSKNTYADGTSPGRAYDTSLAKWLQSPLLTNVDCSTTYCAYTAMRFSANDSTLSTNPWHNHSVVLEQAEQADDLCVLGGGGTCPRPNTVGVAGAGPRFALDGSTDGTRAHTKVHSYYTSAQENSDDSSSYRLIQRGPDGVQILANSGVPVRFGRTDHGASGTASSYGTIDASIPVASESVASFELWNGTPASGATCVASLQCLYSAKKQSQPTISGGTVTPSVTTLVNFTNVTGNDRTPAVSADGAYIAWATDAGVKVQARDSTSNAPTGSSASIAGASDPAWNASGELAYSKGGDVFLSALQVASGNLSFGPAVKLYDHSVQDLPLTAASHPSFSPDGTQLTFITNKDVWVLDVVRARQTSSTPVVCRVGAVAPLPCYPVTSDNATGTTTTPNGEPAWGPNGLIAYDHYDNVGVPSVWTLNPIAASDPGLVGNPYAHTQRVPGASQPAWSGGRLMFKQSDGIGSVDGTTFDLQNSRLRVTNTAAGDSSPAFDATGKVMALERDGKDRDVWVGSLRYSITFTVNDPDGVSNIQADVFLQCADGEVYFPIFAALSPASTAGNVATFTVQFDTALACGGGDIYVRATDGFLTSPLTKVGTVAGSKTPVAAIYSPSPGARYLQYDAVVANGAAFDAEDGATAASYQWYLTGPAGSGFDHTLVGTTARITLDPPYPGGWPVPVPPSATYFLTLRVTDGTGNASETTSSFVVWVDNDHDGVAGPADQTCTSPSRSLDNDPTNGSADSDGDLIPDRDDPQPCVSANNVDVSFNPQSFYVPSSGLPVTMYITPHGQNLSSVDPTTVKIVQIANVPYTQDYIGWSVSSKGVATVKFDRQQLSNFFTNHRELIGSYVPIVVRGTSTSAGFTIRGFDPRYPTVQPA
jgi:hypothetical protein